NLGISSIDLIAAREIADQMAATLERDLTHVPDSIDSRSSRAIDSPSQKLGLRLGLDAATMEKLDEILAADRADEIERRIAAEKSRTAHTRELLESDRDNYVSYLALQSMLSRGLPLSNEQQAFLKQFSQAPEPAPENPEWHEKPDLVDAMRRHLSAEQDAELTRFLDERKARD